MDESLLSLLNSALLAWKGIWSSLICWWLSKRWRLIRRIQCPWTFVIDIHIELSYTIVKSQACSIDSDYITNSVDNWELVKFLCIDDNLSVILLSLWVDSWINHLHWTDESVIMNFVWESSISDHTIEVTFIGWIKSDFIEFLVFILYTKW